MSTTSRPSSAYTVPYGALRFTNMNLRTVPGSALNLGLLVAEHHEAIRADRRFHELPQPRDAEALREDVVHDPAPQRRRHADHQVHAVILGELRPAQHDVAVVLRGLGVARRVVHP